MQSTRPRLKPTMGLFSTKNEALQLLNDLMRPDIPHALLAVVEKPSLMFQHVRTKSGRGDAMWTSPLKFVVMMGHPVLLKMFEGLADAAGYREVFDHQSQMVQRDIMLLKQRSSNRK